MQKTDAWCYGVFTPDANEASNVSFISLNMIISEAVQQLRILHGPSCAELQP